MITGQIVRQHLKLSDTHVVADTIDYLEAKFIFKTDDWDGLDKWVHFAKDSAVYDIRLTEDCIRKEDHLNLSAGMWKVYLHGNEFRDGEVIQRITTDEVVLYVIPTGTLDGEPFPTVPPSAGEQIIASAEAAEASAKAAAAEARQAADEATQYEPEVFWAEYGVTAFADVAAAYDAGKLCGVRYLNLCFIAARTSYATERFIEFTGTSYYRDHYMIRVTASDRWSIYEEELLTRRFDVAENIEVDPDSTEVPTVKAVYEAIQNYSDPAIVEALRKAKESGEFDGEPGENGITPHIGANGNWYIGETDTGIAAQGNPGRGITSVERTSGTGAAGTTDTYTTTYTDGTTSTFGVYNGKNGTNGTNGTSVTVTKVTESTEDGGSNVVTFSDGKTLTVKNGNTGAKGDPGEDYVLTAADKEEIAGMIPGGGGGSGTQVQPDWNQNDTAAADYVKNRPFYEETKWILEKTNVVFEEIDGTMGASLPVLELPTHHQEIIVEYNGTAYTTNCMNIADPGETATVVFGNLSAMGQVDTGEPFWGVMMDSEGYTAMFIPLNGDTSAEISIRYTIIKTLDPKFIGSGDEIEVIDLTAAGFPTITYGETFRIIPSLGLYTKISEMLLAKGMARFRVKMTIKYPNLWGDGDSMAGVTEKEVDIVMSASDISTGSGENTYNLYAVWNGYILYMSISMAQINFRVLKFTDMYYEIG